MSKIFTPSASPKDTKAKNSLTVAELYGVLSRVHMNMELPGDSQNERVEALEKWCAEKEAFRRSNAQ